MRFRWAILLTVVILGCTLSAFAGPTIQIGDPSCNSWNTNLGPLITVDSSNKFTISANSLGGGYFGICNGTNTLWSFVDMKFLTNLLPSQIDCTTTVFGTCTKTAFAGGIDLLFQQPPNSNCQGDACGIPKNQLMTVNLNTGNCVPTTPTDCQNNDGDWTPGQGFFGGTNQNALIPAPEPTSIALLAFGLVGVWQYRRRQ